MIAFMVAGTSSGVGKTTVALPNDGNAARTRPSRAALQMWAGLSGYRSP